MTELKKKKETRGKSPKEVDNSCIDCNKKISRYATRCKVCALKFLHKNMFGKNNPNWKEKLKKNCIICNKKFKVKPSLSKETCSRKCWNIYRHQQRKKNTKRIVIKCDYCNKETIYLCSVAKLSKFHFCTKKCKDLWMSEKMCGENSVLWKGGYNNHYGLNWHKQRRLALNRDENICQICKITSEEYGMNMDVHHKKPFRLFNNYKDANNLDNLICLCRKCHSQEDNNYRNEENT